jgi:hypothetical protein
VSTNPLLLTLNLNNPQVGLQSTVPVPTPTYSLLFKLLPEASKNQKFSGLMFDLSLTGDLWGCSNSNARFGNNPLFRGEAIGFGF